MDADHDILAALDRWVEHGVAPDKLIASHFTAASRTRRGRSASIRRLRSTKATGSNVRIRGPATTTGSLHTDYTQELHNIQSDVGPASWIPAQWRIPPVEAR